MSNETENTAVETIVAIKAKRGRPANPAWKVVTGKWHKLTDKEVQALLAENGFNTSVVNVYLRRQRLAKAGKSVFCHRSRILIRKDLGVSVNV